MCIRGLDSGNPLGRCTRLSLLIAVLASAAPIIIIHAGTWPDLPHFGSRISSGRWSSILCTYRNGHYSSMFGLEHSCSTLFNQSTIWHLISIFRVTILSPFWFVGKLQWLMFPTFDFQHGTEPSGPMPYEPLVQPASCPHYRYNEKSRCMCSGGLLFQALTQSFTWASLISYSTFIAALTHASHGFFTGSLTPEMVPMFLETLCCDSRVRNLCRGNLLLGLWLYRHLSAR